MSPDTLGGFLEAVVTRFADNEAIVFEDQRFTYADVFNHAQRVAVNLGDPKTVAIVMRNRPEMV
ncbi:MAG: hypothetical protein Q8K63_15385, partial [Acidimicrobiales bacterium]|nr:hypothetical protein [Acidimicrobiales bacterium]